MATSSSNSFDTYVDFTKYLAARKCPSCTATFIKEPKDVENLFKQWVNGDVAVCPKMKCRKCSKSTCIACFGKAGGNPTKVDIQGTKLEWCCSRGRLFMIWVFLCGFDQDYSAAKRKDAATTGTGRTVGGSSGVGYGGSSGFGYGGSPFRSQLVLQGKPAGNMFGRDQMAAATQMNAAENAEKVADDFNSVILSFLTTLLPSPDNNTNFDISPPGAVTSMLVNSKVLHKAAELLRNDSLDNAAKRKGLYDALLGLLRNVGTHEATSKAMFRERVSMPDDINLFILSFQGVPKGAKEDTASSLADLLRNLNIQSNMMLKGALNNKNEFDNQEGRDMLWLCRKISDLASYLLEDDQALAMTTECGIVDVPDKEIFATYCYNNLAGQLSHSPKGRIKRLITEITTLKTGLSTGIFIKFASSRLDVMKFVIIGPQGTPYEGGMFEFDLFCPANYPHEPPRVWFKLRGRGSGCLNPNIHPDGKVCLSLLGTWPGEPWRPGQSTILQVLISIQAMIFCENPVANEPGRGQHTRDSTGYNMNVRSRVVQCGLLEWAQNPPKLWRDVVKLHFEKNGDEILQNVDRWARDHHGPSRGFEGDIKTNAAMLQTALQPYGATYQMQHLGGRRIFTWPGQARR